MPAARPSQPMIAKALAAWSAAGIRVGRMSNHKPAFARHTDHDYRQTNRGFDQPSVNRGQHSRARLDSALCAENLSAANDHRRLDYHANRCG